MFSSNEISHLSDSENKTKSNNNHNTSPNLDSQSLFSSYNEAVPSNNSNSITRSSTITAESRMHESLKESTTSISSNEGGVPQVKNRANNPYATNFNTDATVFIPKNKISDEQQLSNPSRTLFSSHHSEVGNKTLFGGESSIHSGHSSHHTTTGHLSYSRTVAAAANPHPHPEHPSPLTNLTLKTLNINSNNKSLPSNSSSSSYFENHHSNQSSQDANDFLQFANSKNNNNLPNNNERAREIEKSNENSSFQNYRNEMKNQSLTATSNSNGNGVYANAKPFYPASNINSNSNNNSNSTKKDINWPLDSPKSDLSLRGPGPTPIMHYPSHNRNMQAQGFQSRDGGPSVCSIFQSEHEQPSSNVNGKETEQLAAVANGGQTRLPPVTSQSNGYHIPPSGAPGQSQIQTQNHPPHSDPASTKAAPSASTGPKATPPTVPKTN